MVRIHASAATVVLLLAGLACGQGQPGAPIDIAPGFTMNAIGQVQMGQITAEVYHFDTDWKISEQHDVFHPDAAPLPATAPTSHILSGTFDRAAGAFKLTEQVDAIDGGIAYSASVTSDKDLPTNELSVSFSLPATLFVGKQIMIDGQPQTLPAEAAKPNQATLFDKDGVHEVILTTPTGTLTITGAFGVHIQDDRQWGDQRYALRLQFSPATGQIKQSKINFNVKWTPAAA